MSSSAAISSSAFGEARALALLPSSKPHSVGGLPCKRLHSGQQPAAKRGMNRQPKAEMPARGNKVSFDVLRTRL